MLLNGSVYFAISGKSSVGTILLFKLYPPLSTYKIKFDILIARCAILSFLTPDFDILAFFEHVWLFLEIKKARQNLAFSGFSQSERLGSGKTFSELHIHCTHLQKQEWEHK